MRCGVRRPLLKMTQVLRRMSELRAGAFELATAKEAWLPLPYFTAPQAILGVYPDDGPLLLILSRASNALMQDGHGFDPVWEPPGK